MAQQSRPGILLTILRNLRRSLVIWRHEKKTPNIVVGKDEHGNTYFHKAGDVSKSIAETRWVERADKSMEIPPTVPMEWESWLRGRRSNAPSAEESAKLRDDYRQAQQRAGRSEGKSIPEKQKEFPSYKEFETIPGERKDNSKHNT